MKKILLAFGTRPEAVKMCPVALVLRDSYGIDMKICLTGQHRELCPKVLESFGLDFDFDLDVMEKGQALPGLLSRISERILPVLDLEKPDIVLVHGDTASAFAVAYACYFRGIPVGHIEAGLRTGDPLYPFPEEFFRTGIDMISSLCFAPGEKERDNLLREGIGPERIFVVGNTVTDALVRFPGGKKEEFFPSGTTIPAVLTLHRRETLTSGRICEVLLGLREAIEKAENCFVVFPVHPNPLLKDVAESVFEGCSRIRLIPPLGIEDFHSLLSSAKLVLTDSGGVQEEASVLGIPAVILREKSERPLCGALLSGLERDRITETVSCLLTDENRLSMLRKTVDKGVFGNGNTAEKIANSLFEYLEKSVWTPVLL